MTIAKTDFKNGVVFTGGGDGDTFVFTVIGGRYGIGFNATWSSGTVAMAILMPDATTYVPVITSFTADSTAIVDLPRGTYKLTIATASAVQGFVIPIPYPQAS